MESRPVRHRRLLSPHTKQLASISKRIPALWVAPCRGACYCHRFEQCCLRRGRASASSRHMRRNLRASPSESPRMGSRPVGAPAIAIVSSNAVCDAGSEGEAATKQTAQPRREFAASLGFAAARRSVLGSENREAWEPGGQPGRLGAGQGASTAPGAPGCEKSRFSWILGRRPNPHPRKAGFWAGSNMKLYKEWAPGSQIRSPEDERA